jgi:hypothetical protein
MRSTYTVNGLNQYTAAGAANFAYDLTGNFTSDVTTRYIYDIENGMRLCERADRDEPAVIRSGERNETVDSFWISACGLHPFASATCLVQGRPRHSYFLFAKFSRLLINSLIGR